MVELEITEHHNPKLHFHVQWVEVGNTAPVYAEDCFGYETRAEAEQVRYDLIAEGAEYFAALEALEQGYGT